KEAPVFSSWFRHASLRPKGNPSRNRANFRPLFVEALEDRTLLSTYLVNLPGDAASASGALAGDIRYVINQANSDPGSTITFDPSATGPLIVLSHHELAITANMTIRGP